MKKMPYLKIGHFFHIYTILNLCNNQVIPIDIPAVKIYLSPKFNFIMIFWYT